MAKRIISVVMLGTLRQRASWRLRSTCVEMWLFVSSIIAWNDMSCYDTLPRWNIPGGIPDGYDTDHGQKLERLQLKLFNKLRIVARVSW